MPWPYTVVATDGDSEELALRFAVRLSDLFRANGHSPEEVGDNWRGRFPVGSVINIPFRQDPNAGWTLVPYQVPAGPLRDVTNRHGLALGWNRATVTPEALWDHYANREFRAWQLAHGGSISGLVAEGAPPLTLLCLPPPPIPVPAPPHDPAVPRTARALRREDEDLPEPPPGSPYHELPPECRLLFVRSFRARKRGAPGLSSTPGLMPLSYHYRDSDLNTWVTMSRIPDIDINTVARVFQRFRRLSTTAYGRITAQLEYIGWIWWGGAPGFRVVYRNRQGIVDTLTQLTRESPGTAHDHPRGAAEHQRGGVNFAPWNWANTVENMVSSPETECWREVPERPMTQGLHFDVVRKDSDMDLNDIHIDWQVPVVGRDAAGYCNYTGTLDSLSHWAQAMFGGGVPESPFADPLPRVRQLRSELEATRREYRGPTRYESNDPADGGVPAGGTGMQHYRWVDIEFALADIVTDFAAHKRLQACRGYDGWAWADGLHARLVTLAAQIHELRTGHAAAT